MSDNFNTMDDIKSYMKALLLEKEYIDKEIEMLGKIRSNVKQIYQYVALKEKRKDILTKISSCNNYVRNLTSFDCDLLLAFLVKYLSYKDQVIYVYFKNVRESNRSLFAQTSTYTNFLPVVPYNIVTTKENYQKMIAQDKPIGQNADTDNIDDYLRCAQDHKYICLLNDYSYSLLDGINLSSEFRFYPDLKVIAEQLANLKLADPLITDEKRLNIVLDEVKTKGDARKRV